MDVPDFYEDDWDDDIWPQEPRTTYAEAIARLTSGAASRTDVKLEWNGKRGPREDARLAFLDEDGTETLARRISSAEQAITLDNIVRDAHPMPGRHALWYPQEDLIVAHLVGDYDDLITTLSRRLARLRPGTRTPIDSPLGRDVLGELASRGVLVTTDPAAAPSAPARTLRLKTASMELGTLYRRGYQHASWVAVELRGFRTSDVLDAEQVLADYGTSYLHEVARSSGVSLRLWDPSYRLTRGMTSCSDGKAPFPVRKYDPIPAALYAAGNAADRDPLERYLKFYQVLEYYMPRAADDLMKKQGVLKIEKAVTPYPTGVNDSLRAERNKLAAVIDDAVTEVQITGFLRGSHVLKTLNDQQVIRGVRTLATDPSGNPTPGRNYRQDLSERIYDIRCRIVHVKESDGGKNSDPLLPYGQEARDLGADIAVIRFLAERVLRRWAESLAHSPGRQSARPGQSQ
ncbi:hypothetical protein [Amycolatopsis cihanbeyliensis]|uniref:hypothetical protein n=1 Tax=Amycolatopsis cihanbeyliensis TaxID=1128664 RepID=UPI00114EF359|nr:hypothetical protein [Amycolatopsis cihanbeyliensis]